MIACLMCPAVRVDDITDNAPVSSRSLATAIGLSRMDSSKHCDSLGIVFSHGLRGSYRDIQGEQSNNIDEQANIALEK